MMPTLDNASRKRAIGMLKFGTMQADVTRFGVARIIFPVYETDSIAGSTADCPRSERPRERQCQDKAD